MSPRAALRSNAEDRRLVESVLDGDLDARRELAARLACVPAYLRRKAARRGIRLERAALEDLAQETILALWRKLDTFSGTSRLETWVCGFCYVELRRFLERGARTPVRVGELEDEPAVEQELPDDTHRRIELALERLGDPAAEIVRIKHYEELSFTEIGQRLAMSSNTAKSLYYRGLSRIRDWLAAGAEGEER